MKKVLGWTAVILIFVAAVKYTLFSHAMRCSDIASEVSIALERYAQCSEDSECTVVTLACPFDCSTPLNKANVQLAFTEVGTYQKNCMMVCPECPPAKSTSASCQNGKCRGR